MGVDPVRRSEATRADSRTRREPASSRTVLSSVARRTSSSCGERTIRGGGRQGRVFAGNPKELIRWPRGTPGVVAAIRRCVRGWDVRDAHPVEFLGRRRGDRCTRHRCRDRRGLACPVKCRTVRADDWSQLMESSEEVLKQNRAEHFSPSLVFTSHTSIAPSRAASSRRPPCSCYSPRPASHCPRSPNHGACTSRGRNPSRARRRTI